MKRVTIPGIRERKGSPQKIAMLTAYAYDQALVVDEAGVDIILVGDSLSNVVLGYETTLPVTLDQMIDHTAAVNRGRKRALLVGDMPFLSYNVSLAESVRNAGRFLKEGGADAVKLEGGVEVAATVEAIVAAGIPVMGHLGLTPQTVAKLGGYKVQGRDALSARHILEGADALQEAGAFAVVLECVPVEVAREVTTRVAVPTIGIGAGPHTDGQVLVFHDVLGLLRTGFVPRFVERYADLGTAAVEALSRFVRDVSEGAFPRAEHGFSMRDGEEKKLPATLPAGFSRSLADGLVGPLSGEGRGAP